MKTIIPNTKTPAGRPCSAFGVILIAFALTSLALAQMAQAVSPAPDGGYPGLNTAEGQNALLGLTTGTANTAVGWFSLKSNTDGTFNTAVGAATLLSNVGNQSTGDGLNNTAIGAAALLFNTTGFDNTAVGAAALLHNIDGSFNTATGVDALLNNAGGSENSAFGWNALESNTTGVGNTAIGANALRNNTEGGTNTSIGVQALFTNTTGQDNTATGFQALFFNDGDPNNLEGSDNCAFGSYALGNSTTGDSNSAFGWSALGHNTIGFNNTAIGALALASNTDHHANTAVGTQALQNATGGFNIGLGVQAGFNITTANNVICIGGGGENTDNSCYIGNIVGKPVDPATAAFVLIDSSGKLGTATSSRRFKRDIKPMGEASEAILALKPVTFHYKSDPKNTPCFGLIAEEVAEVNPDLVARDENGDISTVRYEQVNAMLLNEFIKEHKKVQQLEVASAQQRNDFEATIAELRKEIAGVVARSKNQDEKIQKVSAQVELNQTVSRRVATK